jgi:formylglycine-generating enzyme required for sulfatase activity
MRRRLVFFLIVLSTIGIVVVAWTLADLPPVRYVLRYGLHPGCEPTGEKFTAEGVEFVEIGPGIFRMGSDYLAEGGDWLGKLCAPFGLPWGQKPEPSDEMPVRWVEFRRGFWMATTEITNAQYERFKKEHERSEFSMGEDTPVIEVSWEDAKAYCTWLATKAERPIRLPSEAEWECACRAGGDGEFTFGNDEERLSEYAWFGKDWESGARGVATKRPNLWGLYDLHGNVWEWCADTYHGTYKDAPTDGSAWTEGGEMWQGAPLRVGRSGTFVNPAVLCRSAARDRYPPVSRSWYLGFRPAFVPSD